MKKVSLLIAAFALVLGFSQCRKPNLPVLNGETQHVVLNASWDNGGSKIEQDGSLLKWTEGDKLTVTGGATGELSCKDATLGTFEGTITKTTGGSITFTFHSEDYKENFKEQTGALADAVSLKSAELDYKADGNYGTVSMGMPHAVLKLDLNYFAPSPSKADVTVNIRVKAEAESKEESVIASVKCASDNLGEVYVAVPANEKPATYTFSGNNKTVEKSLPKLDGSTFYTAGGTGGAEVIEPAAPATPKFTVADGKTVEFAPGNLWYGTEDGAKPEEKAFHFEKNQWDTDPTAEGTWNPSHVSLFKWSDKDNAVTGDDTYSGVLFCASNFTVDGDSHPDWRTLSDAEWNYLLYNRTSATDLRTWKELDGGTHKGLVILPDGTESSVMSDITSTADLASFGAVFLPAAGYRYGTDVYRANLLGYYWSNTPNKDNENFVYCIYAIPTGVTTTQSGRKFGLAVRLVRDIK